MDDLISRSELMQAIKRQFHKFRNWVITKLGGYVEPPIPRVRIDRADVPIRTVKAEARYMTGCDHEYIKKLVAKKIAEELCDANLVSYEYFDNPPYDPSQFGVVRASVRVIEGRSARSCG